MHPLFPCPGWRNGLCGVAHVFWAMANSLVVKLRKLKEKLKKKKYNVLMNICLEARLFDCHVKAHPKALVEKTVGKHEGNMTRMQT